MRGRKWSVDEKLGIVLEGMDPEKTVTRVCKEHGISQAQYYKWKNRFIEAGRQGLERAPNSDENDILRKEIDKLTRLVGKMALEIDTLRKNNEMVGR